MTLVSDHTILFWHKCYFYSRIEKALNIISREIQRIKLGDEIQAEVHDEITKTQREYYLREQMKAIKKELGEDEGTVEIKELEEKIKAANMPKESEKVAMKELDRLSRIPTQSPEYNVSRTYIEWLADLHRRLPARRESCHRWCRRRSPNMLSS